MTAGASRRKNHPPPSPVILTEGTATQKHASPVSTATERKDL